MAPPKDDSRTLLRRLGDPDWRTRAEAVRRLGRLRRPTLAPNLEHALYDDNTAVTQAAAEALLELRTLDAAKAIVRALEATGSDVDVAEEVQAVLLRRSCEPWLTEALMTLARFGREPSMRLGAVRALGFPLAASRARAVLEVACSDLDADVRSAAKDALDFLHMASEKTIDRDVL